MRGSRIIVGIAVLIFIALAMIPWVDGFMFKQNYYHFVKALEADNTLNISILEYHQGLWSSTAKVSIKPKMDAAGVPHPANIPGGYTTPSIILDQVISHGPLARDESNNRFVFALATIHSKMHLPAAIEGLLLGGQPNANGVMESNTVVTLGGNYLTQVKTPVFKSNIPNLVNVVWQGLSGNLDFYMNGQRLQKLVSDMKIGAISAKGAPGSIDMNEVSIKYDITPDASGLWNGGYHFSAPGFTLGLENETLSAKNIDLNYLFKLTTPKLYDIKMQLTLGQFIAPQFAFNSSSSNWSVENLDAQALLNLVNTINHLKSMRGEMTPQQAQQIMALVPSLITPTTLIKNDIAINTSYGRALLNTQVSWSAPVKILDEVAKQAIGKGEFRISTSLVDRLIALAAAQAASQTATPMPAVSQQPTEASFLKQIDSWSTQNILDLSVGIQIKDLVQTHLSPADFSRNIDQFVKSKQIPANIAEQLKMEYAAIKASVSMPPVPAPQPVVSPEAQMRAQLDALIKQGLITQDKTDYITILTLEQGVLKANGQSVSAF